MKTIFGLVNILLISYFLLTNNALALSEQNSITMYVPFSVGGPADTIARHIEYAVESTSDIKITILNQGGASGNIGMRSFIQSKKSLLFTSENILMNKQYLTDSYPHDIINHVNPIYFFANSPFIVYGHNSIKDFQTLIEESKKRYIMVGSSTQGSGSFEAYKLLCETYKVLEKCQRVGYRSFGSSILDIMTGRIDIYATLYANHEHLISLQTINPLTILDINSFSQLQQVPLITDFGYRIQVNNWYGLFHKGFSDKEIRSIRESINNFFDKKKLYNLGYTMHDPSPVDFWNNQIELYK